MIVKIEENIQEWEFNGKKCGQRKRMDSLRIGRYRQMM